MSRGAVKWGVGGLVAASLLAVTGGFLVWVQVTGRMIEALPQFVAAARQDGWDIHTGAVRRAFWPGVARLELRDVIAVRPLGGTSVQIILLLVDLVIAPQAPGLLRVEPRGGATLQLGTDAPIPIAGEMAALVPLDGVGATAVRVRALTVGSAAAGVQVARADATIEAGAMEGSAGPIVVSPPFPAPFDAGATVSGRFVATPPVPPAATPGASARAWQSAGGRIDLPAVLVTWGKLQVSGGLSGGLDGALQPTLEGRLQVTGAPEMLDAAVRAGVVGSGPAGAAKAVLTLLTLAAKGGPITVPVQVRERTLTVAQFPLLRLPLLAWDPS